MRKTVYVDGYVLTVTKKNFAAYRRMATMAGRIWRKHGALRYVECVGEDMRNPWGKTFTKLAKPKRNEVVVFSYIEYRSRAHRDAVNAKVMKDHAMQDTSPKDQPLPFDMKRMAWGGFKAFVSY